MSRLRVRRQILRRQIQQRASRLSHLHGADGHVAGEVLQVRLREKEARDTGEHIGQDSGGDGERAQLSKSHQ